MRKSKVLSNLKIEDIPEENQEEFFELASLIRADECRANFYEFFLEFWGEIVPAELVANWHIKFICDELQKAFEIWESGKIAGDYIINVPPASSKSTIVSVMFPAWCWVRKPSTRLITASYSSSLSLDLGVKNRDLIRSEKFKRFYPDWVNLKQDVNNKGLYENDKKGRRLSTSIGATVTGFHADILIVDDPINPKQASSEVERKSANEWLEATLSNRKTDKLRSFQILVMQRLHEEDPTGRKMEGGDEFSHICLPAEITEINNVYPKSLEKKYKKGLLDPVRMSKKVLEKEKNVLGGLEYGGQYLQSPRDAEGYIFKREWFKMYRDLPMGRPLRVICSWDTAFKTKQESDFSVCTVWAEYKEGFFLIDFFMGKVEYTELKQNIELKHKANYAHWSIIEDKASGQSAIQELKRMNIPIKPVTPDKDKISRANQITPPFESGNVYFPYENYTDKIIDQMTGFPNTTHDDIVDSITQFFNWARETTAGSPIIVSSGKRKSKKLFRGY